MDLERSVVDDVVVLAVSGRLNLSSASRLKAEVDAGISNGDTRIVLDLSALDFIDSSGLGAVIGGLKTARQAGGDLRIANPGEQVLTVLGLTNLDRILRPFPSVQDALSQW